MVCVYDIASLYEYIFLAANDFRVKFDLSG